MVDREAIDIAHGANIASWRRGGPRVGRALLEYSSAEKRVASAPTGCWGEGRDGGLYAGVAPAQSGLPHGLTPLPPPPSLPPTSFPLSSSGAGRMSLATITAPGARVAGALHRQVRLTLGLRAEDSPQTCSLDL